MLNLLLSWLRVCAWMDPYLHAAVGLGGLVGAGFSVYAVRHTWQQWRLLDVYGLNGLRRSVVKSHLVMHAGILACQVMLVVVGSGMLLLPSVPPEMFNGPAGERVLLVLVIRKGARVFTSLCLLGIAVYKVRWLRRTFPAGVA